MDIENKTLINAGQIRAARGLLNWSQKDLADSSGLSIATIRKIEAGHISPRGKTMNSIANTLSQAGIEFQGTSGVRIRDDQVTTLEGDDCYEQFMENIYYSLKDKGGEVLFLHADMTRCSDDEIGTLLLMKKRGITFRRLVKEGDTYLNFPLKEFRWMPSKYFQPNLQVIFDNCIAICIYPDEKMRSIRKIVAIRNKYLAGAMRSDFDFLWDNCRKPTHSTAPQIHE